MVITGGGSGIMQAVNEGAGPEKSFGVNILLPFEQKPNPVLIGNPRLITYKYFFNRKGGLSQGSRRCRAVPWRVRHP